MNPNNINFYLVFLILTIIFISLFVYSLVVTLGDLLYTRYLRAKILARMSARNKRVPSSKAVTSDGIMFPPAVYSKVVEAEDLWGVNDVPWMVVYPVLAGAGALLSLFFVIGKNAGVENILIYSAGGAGIGLVIKTFYSRLQKMKARTESLALMNLLLQELTFNYTLSNALNSIVQRYRQDVQKEKQSSWMYRNYPLARLVYLVTTTASTTPAEIIQKLGEEMGDVDVIRVISQMAIERTKKTNDPNQAFQEQVKEYLTKYYMQMREEIPRLGEKVATPLYVSHLVPFFLLLLYPIVFVTNQMLAFDIMDGQTIQNPLLK